MIDLFTSLDDFGNKFTIKVTTKASSNKIKVEQKEDGSCQIRVYVTEAPEDGKANNAVIKLLSKELKVSKSSIKIIDGLKSRIKTILIDK